MQVTDAMVAKALEAYDAAVPEDNGASANGMEAALTAALAEMWRPIEEAPKDGPPLLLLLARKPDRNYLVDDLCPNHAIGFWMHGGWKSIEVEDCGGMGGEYTGWMPDWVNLDLSPTHFMTLPAPPMGK